MSRVRNRDTSLERLVRTELHKKGLRFRKHVKGLVGSPDIVFARARVAVFIDGDFWHGWRFPLWKQSLRPFWRTKIEKNRERDRSNFRKLRRTGWLVLRIWQHEIERHLSRSVTKIEAALLRRRA